MAAFFCLTFYLELLFGTRLLMKAFLISFLLFSAVPVFAEYRTWTSADGKTVEAEFLLRTMNSVRIKTEAGKTLNLPFDRLSRKDRVYVELHSPPVLSVEVNPNENVGDSVNGGCLQSSRF